MQGVTTGWGQHAPSIHLVALAAMILLLGCTREEDEPAARKLKRLQQEADSAIVSSQKREDDHRALSDRLKAVEEEKLLLSQKLDTLVLLHRSRDRSETTQESQQRRDSPEAARKALQEDRKTLKEELASLGDSIRQSENRLDRISEALDSLSLQQEFVSRVDQQAVGDLRSGVSGLDRTLDSLAREQRIAQQELSLAEKRIDILRKKIEAYGEERDLYVTEKNELMRTNAPEVDLHEIDLKIREIDNTVGLEEAKISLAKTTIKKAQGRIGAIGDAAEDLQVRIARGYDKKAVLEEFIGGEAENIAAERARLGAEREQLQTRLKELTRKRQKLESSQKDLGPEIPPSTDGEPDTFEPQENFSGDGNTAEDPVRNGPSAQTNRLPPGAPQKRPLKTTQPDTAAARRLARLPGNGARGKVPPGSAGTAAAIKTDETSHENAETSEALRESGGTLKSILGIVLFLVLVGFAGLYLVGRSSRMKKQNP